MKNQDIAKAAGTPNTVSQYTSKKSEKPGEL